MRRLARAAAATASALLVGVFATPGTAAADDGVADIVGPAMVIIKSSYTGYVQIPPSYRAGDVDAAGWTNAPITVDGSCSGFAVDRSGRVATAGHCVNPAGPEILSEFRKRAIVARARPDAAPTDVQGLLQRADEEGWKVSASKDGGASKAAVNIEVRQPDGAHQVIPEWTKAEVVAFQTFEEGDAALLKVADMPSGAQLTPLVVSDVEPKPGTDITSVGFPAAVFEVVDKDKAQQPSYLPGKVSSRQTNRAGKPNTQVSATLGGGMSGGPTVDAENRVIGINSYITNPSAGPSFNFITDNRELRTYLAEHGVDLAAADGAGGSSTPTWIYAAAGGAGAVVVLGAIALVVRSRRAAAARAAAGPAPFGGPGPGPTGPAFGGQQQFGGQQFGGPGGAPGQGPAGSGQAPGPTGPTGPGGPGAPGGPTGPNPYSPARGGPAGPYPGAPGHPPAGRPPFPPRAHGTGPSAMPPGPRPSGPIPPGARPMGPPQPGPRLSGPFPPAARPPAPGGGFGQPPGGPPSDSPTRNIRTDGTEPR